MKAWRLAAAVAVALLASRTVPADDLSLTDSRDDRGRSITLTGDVIGGDLVLQWTACLGAAAYWVYGADNEAYFPAGGAPGYLHRLAVLSPLSRTWSSPAGIGDEGHSWAYLVLAVDPHENELDNSNRFGEFDFEYGYTPGWLTVGLALDDPMLSNGENVCLAIPYCTAVAIWHAPSQGWCMHTLGTPPGFDCSVTMPLFAYVTQDSVWTHTGSVIDSTAYSFDLWSGWNFITVPLNKAELATGELLGQDVPNCTNVARWEAAGQGWVQHTVGSGANNWAVHVGHPYMVYCNAPGTWGDWLRAPACRRF
jgi:hypothetical protein